MKISSLALALFVAAGNCVAQSDSSTVSAEPQTTNTPILSAIGNDGLTALRIAGHVVSAPARWDGTDWLLAGGVVGATAVSFFLDNDVYNLMERNHSSFNNDVSRVVVEYGSGYVVIGLPIAMYITGLVIEDQWIRETAVLMGSTVLLTSAITTAGKIVIGRARPYTGLGNHEFKPFNAQAEFMSFPSGHTTAAFALSAVLAARIKNPWASVGLYGAATAAAVSRMYTRDHWLSDVVFTAAYTTAVAHSVVKWFENESENDAHTFNIIPTTSGVSVVWRF